MSTSTFPNQIMAHRLRPVWILLLTQLLWSAGVSLAGDLPLAVTVTIEKGAPNLRITGSAGQWLQIQFRTTLSASTPWQVLTNVLLNQTTTSIVDMTAPPGKTRFYRLSAGLLSPFSPAVFIMGSPATEVGRNTDRSAQYRAA
jgi:hypothetical protein